MRRPDEPETGLAGGPGEPSRPWAPTQPEPKEDQIARCWGPSNSYCVAPPQPSPNPEHCSAIRHAPPGAKPGLSNPRITVSPWQDLASAGPWPMAMPHSQPFDGAVRGVQAGRRRSSALVRARRSWRPHLASGLLEQRVTGSTLMPAPDFGSSRWRPWGRWCMRGVRRVCRR